MVVEFERHTVDGPSGAPPVVRRLIYAEGLIVLCSGVSRFRSTAQTPAGSAAKARTLSRPDDAGLHTGPGQRLAAAGRSVRCHSVSTRRHFGNRPCRDQ